jgi:hypothetical protein
MKCKNPDCENIIDNKIYCSLKCRNIYVNKYLRDYKKNKDGLLYIKNKISEEYLKNPKRCKYCEKEISFEKRKNTYCNSSCMASYTNKLKKGKEHNFSDVGINNILLSIKKRYNVDEYYVNPKKCINCDNVLTFQKKFQKYCNWNCKKEYYSKNSEYYNIYHFLTNFKFHINTFKDEFDFTLIEKNGWYKAKNHGDNVDGVSRDHKISVKDGFRRLINPLILAHPSNCELVKNRHNQSKSDKCSLTLEDLLFKIKEFDNKYGNFYKEDLKTYICLNELLELYKNN